MYRYLTLLAIAMAAGAQDQGDRFSFGVRKTRLSRFVNEREARGASPGRRPLKMR